MGQHPPAAWQAPCPAAWQIFAQSSKMSITVSTARAIFLTSLKISLHSIVYHPFLSGIHSQLAFKTLYQNRRKVYILLFRHLIQPLGNCQCLFHIDRLLNLPEIRHP